ncbi:non-ribosomal peptide synthetase [Streptomyces roseofulvus]|uniref:non-ribosomal peptide synthetase n=1 Tax=Streptomyces roseofulvus TaxID=33902 RepID=UPI0031FCEB46
MTTLQLSGIADGPHLAEPVGPVCDEVMEQARRHPDRLAVVCGSDHLTYRQLAAAAEAVAAEQDLAGLRPGGARIGILAHRTAATVAHALGVSLGGRSFVFVDPEAPEAVVQHIRTTADVSLITDPRTGTPHTGPGTDPAAPKPARQRSLDDEAYVLYTSGSTGRPKGVSVSQRNLASSTAARLTVYEPYGTPVFLLLSPFHFDSSVAGVWGTLAAGGTVVVAREDERRDPAALFGLVARYGVTHLLAVPSFYAELLLTLGQDTAAGEAVASLRMAICAGEALPQSVIDGHFALLPGVALANEYGPTECTVWATYRVYERPGRSTIGRPIPGTSVHLLDDRLQPAEAGGVGQIALSGPGVSGGYVADAQQTNARFVTLTDASGATARAYLTGDLGRWSDEDGLEFAGRIDNEVKIRGVRVTIESIEEALVSHPGVHAAAVAYDAETSTTFAFVTVAPGAEADAASVRARAEAVLGSGVTPDRVVFAETLPRTAHDKIDRAALLASVRPLAPVAGPDAGGGLAAQIARAWSDVLGVDVLETERAGFFELGGNSLSIMRLARALGKIAGHPIGVKEVYRRGTIAQQVELLSTP